jgi:hypothetical protein
MADTVDSFDRSQVLRDGLRHVHWQLSDLWIASIALGGHLDLSDVTNITSGLRAPSRAEYNVLATALNEQFLDLGQNHPLAYWDDLRPTT